jgi:hypothetical protein
MSKSIITLSIDTDILDILRSKEVNMSKTVNEFLKVYVQEYKDLLNLEILDQENIAKDLEIKLKTIQMNIKDRKELIEKELKEKNNKKRENDLKVIEI